MSYKYTDENGASLEAKLPHDGNFLIGFMGETGEYANIVVRNDDAPRIALEILKVAGWADKALSVAMALGNLADSLDHAKEAAALDKRRGEVCKELGAFFTPGAPDQPLLRAIDRIIALESESKP